MKLPEIYPFGGLESGQISFFQSRKEAKNAVSETENAVLAAKYKIKGAPESFKWDYLKKSDELVTSMDIYKEGFTLLPHAVIGINGDEGAGKTQLVFDLAVLYGVDLVHDIKTGGQALRQAGEKLRKRHFFGREKVGDMADQAGFVERTDEDDNALDNAQFSWVENPSEKPKLVDSRLIGLAIYSIKHKKTDLKAASFYIISSAKERWHRLAERTGESEEEVETKTNERRKLDIERYTRLYKGKKRFEIFGDEINPHNSAYYDRVIDNTYRDREMAIRAMHEYLVETGLVGKKAEIQGPTEVYDRERHDLEHQVWPEAN
jgi:cytidylate kinase